jgi:pimeloyl-ACP methyl ester carboxylesterase
MEIDIDNINLKIRGDHGHPLICLHGGMGVGSDYFSVPGVEDLAQKGLRVITYDQRGNGIHKEANIELISMDQWTRDVSLVAEALSLEEYSVLGHSYGGFIAMKHAIMNPNKLKSVVVVDSAPFSYTYLGSTDAIRKSTDITKDEFTAMYRKAWDGFVSGDTVSMALYDGMNISFETYKKGVEEMGSYDIRDELKDIVCPSLIVVGEKDERYIDRAKFMSDNISNSELSIVSDAGHIPFVDKPNEFVHLVSGFIKRHS